MLMATFCSQGFWLLLLCRGCPLYFASAELFGAGLLQVRVLCNGLVETVGRMVVGDWKQPFTAHPKLDSETGKGIDMLWLLGKLSLKVGVANWSMECYIAMLPMSALVAG
jgi:hypothetical protein